MDDSILIEHLATILGFTIFGGVLIFGPIGRAFARRIGGDSTRGHEIDDLRDRMAHLEHTEARVAELEERLEFTERLLARQQQADRLPG
jgi:hypothetical protein